MEQHPIPQNVTTFQFRLVGDMTIKQFGYLAGGIIVGYLCYKLPLPFFFTWPLAITSGILGFGLAFVPVEERPMDVWIASFFNNVYNPTQWVWQKEKRVETSAPPVQQISSTHRASVLTQIINTLSSFFASVVPSPKPSVASPKITTPPAPPASGAILSVHHGTSPFDWFMSIFQRKSKPVSPSLSPGFSFADALAARPAPSIAGRHIEPPKEPQAPPTPPPSAPQSAVVTAAPPLAPATHPAAHERVVELQGQLSEALAQRERMEKELIAIRLTLQQQTKSASQAPMRQASVMPSVPTGPSTSVRVIAPDAAAKAGLPRLTTFPNVVTGIVKDHYGNLLSGMLITVRDKDDIPLRALKTNKLGQFAASTPLPNNTYIVEIEDPKGGFIFDKAQIALAGAVAPPIEVTAKSQREVERDKLAKEIFGQNQM